MFAEIVSIHFFDYPTDFKGVTPGPGGEMTTMRPSTTYRLEAQCGVDPGPMACDCEVIANGKVNPMRLAIITVASILIGSVVFAQTSHDDARN